MPSREAVLSLLRRGRSYDAIGEELGVTPGLAYMVATGLPADGSDVPSYDDHEREGLLDTSSQHLANPRAVTSQRDPEVGAWMRRRATADDAMRAAALEHGIEPPAVDGAGESDDVASVLGREHNQVEYLLKELEATPSAAEDGDADDGRVRVAVVELLARMLLTHEELEETYFWPKVASWYPDGTSVAEQATGQEGRGTELLRRFEGVSALDPEFDDLVKQLAKALRAHVAFEDGIFLRVEDDVDARERAEVGRAIKQARARMRDAGVSGRRQPVHAKEAS